MGILMVMMERENKTVKGKHTTEEEEDGERKEKQA
jgi:hypothetical protein